MGVRAERDTDRVREREKWLGLRFGRTVECNGAAAEDEDGAAEVSNEGVHADAGCA